MNTAPPLLERLLAARRHLSHAQMLVEPADAGDQAEAVKGAAACIREAQKLLRYATDNAAASAEEDHA